jgi:hypothetical protein
MLTNKVIMFLSTSCLAIICLIILDWLVSDSLFVVNIKTFGDDKE